MKKAMFLLYAFLFASYVISQEGFIDDGNGGCKTFTNKTENRHNIWIGDCINGYAEGNGTLKVFEDDTLLYTYVGSVSIGKSEGQGTYTWTNGYKYVGQLKNNNKEGQGTFTGPDSMEYVGQWKDNNYEGDGMLTWADGKKYVGQWKNNKKEGQGTFAWPDGKEYIGQWKDNNFEGDGTLTWADGKKYVGQWKNNKKEGRGTFTWPDGKEYIGQWKDNNFEGEGTFTWPDGMEYVGQWKDNKYEGEGMLTKADGRIYVGQWKENKYDGKGVVYRSDGSIEKDGYWSENIFLGTILTEEKKQALKSVANRKKIPGQTCKVKLKKEEFDFISGIHGYFYYYHVNAPIINEDFIIVKFSKESACGTIISHDLYKMEITGSERFIHTFETREEAFGKMIKFCGCDAWVNE